MTLIRPAAAFQAGTIAALSALRLSIVVWPAACEFSYSSRLTELALLGVLALRTRKKILWDAVNLKALNVPEADAIIQGEPYRQGWELPG